MSDLSPQSSQRHRNELGSAFPAPDQILSSAVQLPWSELQQHHVPLAIEVLDLTPGILTDVINHIVFPHDDDSRWSEDVAVKILRTLVKQEPITRDLLEQIAPDEGQFELHHEHMLKFHSRTCTVQDSFRLELHGRAAITPQIVLGVRRNGDQTSSPFLRLQWDSVDLDSATPVQIGERWAATTYLTHLAGDWFEGAAWIRRPGKEGDPFLVGQRTSLNAALRADAVPWAERERKLALHPELISLCVVDVVPSFLQESRPLVMRVYELHKLITERLGLPMGDVGGDLRRAKIRELQQVGNRHFLGANKRLFELVVVDGRVLIAAPSSTGEDLLHSYRALRRYEELLKQAPRLKDLKPVQYSVSEASSDDAVTIGLSLHPQLSPQLLRDLYGFIRHGAALSRSEMIDQLLEVAATGDTLSVKTDISHRLLQTSDDEEEQSDDSDEELDRSSDEIVVTRYATVQGATALGEEHLKFYEIDTGDEGPSSVMLELERQAPFAADGSTGGFHAMEIEVLLEHLGKGVPAGRLSLRAQDDYSGRRCFALIDNHSAWVEIPRVPEW